MSSGLTPGRSALPPSAGKAQGGKTPGSCGRSGRAGSKTRVFGTRLGPARSFNNLSGLDGSRGNGSGSEGRARRNITPSRSQAGAAASQRTPGKPGGDRFCPSRSSFTMDMARLELSRKNSSANNLSSKSAPASPAKAEASKAMGELLNGTSGSSGKILGFQASAAPAAPLGFTNAHAALFSTHAKASGASSCRKLIFEASRHIPTAPDRVLDAPNLVDDFYLNLIDWSARDVLAVALGNSAYVWHAETGSVERLAELEEEEYVSGLSWSGDGAFLALGASNGNTLLYDLASQAHLRTLKGAEGQRVAALSWNGPVVTTGAMNGAINHFDVRVPQPLVLAVPDAHSQEVCGLAWSPDGRHLASGANDNRLLVWSAAAGQRTTEPTPLHTITHHQAAVKALAWCPWQPSLLASGGGTADRHIRVWNVNSGACLQSVDALSQVSGLAWSSEYRELISSHGAPGHQLSIWKYPDFTKVAELEGHTERVLGIALSPDGQAVVSCAADESLRVWKAFARDPKAAKKAAGPAASAQAKPSRLNNLIR